MFAAIVHEVSHGYAAYLCGDTTARDAGRLTLNPLKHLDPFGSVILPLVMAFAGGPIFGYARPVPFNPYRLHDRRRDALLVALAGPLSNIVQAVLASILFRVGLAAGWLVSAPIIMQIVSLYVWVNLILCFFNLIPLPPLDGSHIIAFFLRGKALTAYYTVQRYSLPILLVVLYVLPIFLGFNPLGIYFSATAENLYRLFLFGV